ncbi:MAG TPA: ATP-binding protein [Candidatus Acidoferrales bacterium]
MTRTDQPNQHAPGHDSSGTQLLFSRTVGSQTDAIEVVVQDIMKAVQGNGCGEAPSAAIELSLREALANAMIHGNGRNPSKQVAVDCFRQPDCSILLVVRDEGQGFDLRKVRNPTEPENIYRSGGRGIFLISHFMDEVEFNDGGREIRMKKNL